MDGVYIGLDLGQKQDFTAIAVVRRADVLTGEINRATYERISQRIYSLEYLERVPLGTSYVDIVAQVVELADAIPGGCDLELVVDATGVGAPVVDLLRESRLRCAPVPVSITGGDQATFKDGLWRVPKRDLVVGLQLMFEQKELRIAGRLPGAEALVRELMGMRVKVSAAGHESFGASGAREGAHDDLVLAVALACWRAKELRVRERVGRLFW